MKKRIIPILVTAVAFLLLFTACSGEKATDGNANDTTVSSQENESKEDLPNLEDTVFGAFESVDMNANKVDHTIFEGKKLTMVNIWATFCGPCINEMPDLEKISREYADKGFQIVGMVCDVTQKADGTYVESVLKDAEDVVKSTGVTYVNILPSVSLNEAKLSEVYTIPETIFIDENGKQVGESYIGSRSYEDWCNIIDGLLGE